MKKYIVMFLCLATCAIAGPYVVLNATNTASVYFRGADDTGVKIPDGYLKVLVTDEQYGKSGEGWDLMSAEAKSNLVAQASVDAHAEAIKAVKENETLRAAFIIGKMLIANPQMTEDEAAALFVQIQEAAKQP